eukprot:66528-Alexandrium_andersonii.AAC.1
MCCEHAPNNPSTGRSLNANEQHFIVVAHHPRFASPPPTHRLQQLRLERAPWLKSGRGHCPPRRGCGLILANRPDGPPNGL